MAVQVGEMAGEAYSPAMWAGFFSALVSAGAALAGLLFVSMSINLQRILGAVQLVARAAKALATAVSLPVVAVICLVPGQEAGQLGVEMLSVSLLVTAGVGFLYWKSMHRNPFIAGWQKVVQALVLLCSTLPFVGAGVSLMAGRGGGLYWAAVGAVGALLAPAIDAWVLLIEIQR